LMLKLRQTCWVVGAVAPRSESILVAAL
jgi:hypothetical protein